ncbi:hypothetical protein FRAHR75_820003 [Frankia sp. Hr75.2]|nr:hypothetical protein FRAHR75_820003 [Frankia sp. Hr75.2]
MTDQPARSGPRPAVPVRIRDSGASQVALFAAEPPADRPTPQGTSTTRARTCQVPDATDPGGHVDTHPTPRSALAAVNVRSPRRDGPGWDGESAAVSR